MGLLSHLFRPTTSLKPQNPDHDRGTQKLTQLPVTQDSNSPYITLQPQKLNQRLELSRSKHKDELNKQDDWRYHSSILKAYLRYSSVFRDYFSNNSKQTSIYFGNSKAPYKLDTELAKIRTPYGDKVHVHDTISFNSNFELEIDIRGRGKVNYPVSSMSGVLYFLSSMNTRESERILPYTFIDYINNKIVPTKNTDFNLPNMFYLFLVLNADLGFNYGNKVNYAYTPEPIKETLIKEVMDMYLTYLTLTTNTFELNRDEEVFLRYEYNEREDKKYTDLVSDVNQQLSYLNRTRPSYYDFDLTLLPKTRFREKYKKYLGYKMFYILLNYVPEKQDFEDSKTFRDLWVLSKTTTDKIDNILNKLFKVTMENNQPSQDIVDKTIDTLNEHLDILLKALEESITKINAEITKPSINTQKLEREIESLLEDL